MQFFQRFRISPDILRQDPNLWKTTTEYKEAKVVLTTLKAVNNSAERGVNLIEESKDKFTKQDEQKQYMLQVIFSVVYFCNSQKFIKIYYL